MKLAEHNRIQLIWVPKHMGTDGNEMDNQQATQGSHIHLSDLSLPWAFLQRLLLR